MKINKISALSKLACLLPLLMVGASFAAESLNVSTSLSPDDPIYKGLQSFKKALKAVPMAKSKLSSFPAVS